MISTALPPTYTCAEIAGLFRFKPTWFTRRNNRARLEAACFPAPLPGLPATGRGARWPRQAVDAWFQSHAAASSPAPPAPADDAELHRELSRRAAELALGAANLKTAAEEAMSDKTSIEWTDATWNPIRARDKKTGKVGWHCEHVSEGCRNCYAEKMNLWRGTGLAYKPGHLADVEPFLDAKALALPPGWRAPRKIFVCSMTDLFADFVPDEWIDQIVNVMARRHRQHVFQVLTKRPERMQAYFSAFKPSPPEDGYVTRGGVWSNYSPPGAPIFTPKNWPPEQIYLGVSVEDQATADARIPLLLDTPAAVRFVSAEPLLGTVDFTKMCGVGFDALHGVAERARKIDWIICGGESGPGARPMHPDWARSIRDQCAAAGVPFFFKQWGEWRPAPEIIDAGGSLFHKFEDGAWAQRVGKKAAGALLDGREHREFPA